MRSAYLLLPLICLGSLLQPARADSAELSKDRKLQLMDIFQLEYASDPQISPDGKRIVYVRNSMDIMNDRTRSSLWMINSDGSDARPLTTGDGHDFSPRWSPDGERLLYVSAPRDGSPQLYLRWLDSGQTARLTQLTRPPASLVWSPDGRQIAFTMLVPEALEPFIELPEPPAGARWAEPAKVIDRLVYRVDGEGYVEPGHNHLFVLAADGRTARQLTTGNFQHQGRPSWTPDSRALVLEANRRPDWPYHLLDTEIYKISVTKGELTALTDRRGPDISPVVSPDGRWIAYLGFDDARQGYQLTHLYVMRMDGSERRQLVADLDRDVETPVWSADSQALFFAYNDQGMGKIARVALDGAFETLAESYGESIGRPYSGGSFSVAHDGTFAYTHTRADHPADVAIAGAGQESRRLTRLNDDLLGYKELGKIEEIWFASSFDGRRIQGWIVKPPGFDSDGKYPLLLEIHGGPFANYGDRFSAEAQLFAAAGYVVLYLNPRGSTSYGESFGNLIHHNYPSQDFDDLMSGVDAVIERGYIDERNLFVTGGSGGGTLTAWVVGKTDRFRAAVSAKPVINWYSFVLTADFSDFFYKYWFPGVPWEHVEHYMKRSPLSLVGNVSTPTMLLTGEVDYRTPISESEQFYQALKLRQIDTALVRIPEASHSIAARPSYLMSKVAHILAWFEKYRVR